MFYGKLVAGALGLLVGGPIGLLIGLWIGHAFDKGLASLGRLASPENVARMQESFSATTFQLLGYLAKTDGRVSQEEIDHTEVIFNQMGLTPEQRKRGIEWFKKGTAADFQLEPVVASFLEVCALQKQLQQTLLLFLISMALSDQKMDPAEHAALQRIARLLGYRDAQLEQLLRMAQAQGSFHQRGGASPRDTQSQLSDAYTALGVSPTVADKDIKRAYRKLMSANHPDKLIAQGVPEDMVKIATAKSQDIQAAYEMVKKHRGM